MIIERIDSSKVAFLSGLSDETKPTTFAEGSRFLESDTHEEFLFLNGEWKNRVPVPEIPRPEKASLFCYEFDSDGLPIAAERIGFSSTVEIIPTTLKKFKTDATTIATVTFKNTDKLEELDFPEAYQWTDTFQTSSNGWWIKKISCPKLKMAYNYCCCYHANLEQMDTEQITYVAEMSFSQCEKLPYLNFPNVITAGRWNHFDLCYSAVWADLHNWKGNPTYWYEVSDGTFSCCYSLETVVLGPVKGFGSYAFASCNSLKCIDIRRSTVKTYYTYNTFDGMTKDKKTIDVIVADDLYDEYIADESWALFNIVKASDAPEDPLAQYRN